MFGITKEVMVKFVDARISQAHNTMMQRFIRREQVQSLQDQIRTLTNKLDKLTTYLGVEYTEECVKGFVKAKKTKKK